MQKFPMTVQGEHALRVELDDLKAVQRPTVIASIAEAREHGDLKENAEYHAAKDEQGFIEARIRDIESKLSNAEIIDVTSFGKTGRVIFGATVELMGEDDGREITYKIVGVDEADISSGTISVSSPIARALIGKDEGNVAVVDAPGGEKSYEIIKISYI